MRNLIIVIVLMLTAMAGCGGNRQASGLDLAPSPKPARLTNAEAGLTLIDLHYYASEQTDTTWTYDWTVDMLNSGYYILKDSAVVYVLAAEGEVLAMSGPQGDWQVGPNEAVHFAGQITIPAAQGPQVVELAARLVSAGPDVNWWTADNQGDGGSVYVPPGSGGDHPPINPPSNNDDVHPIIP